MKLTVVILTKNEERHIVRCLESVAPFASQVLVVDSGSTDSTVNLALEMGAVVLHNPWVNYSAQLNWAIDQVSDSTDWIMRLDADEVVDASLAREICGELPKMRRGVEGVYVSRRMNFLGRRIHYGGVFPIRVLRLFRQGCGRCETRWMDEHILVKGEVAQFEGEIIDDNLNSLAWWTAKHNGYSDREVVDILNAEYGFMPHETIADLASGHQAGVKRWIKERIYLGLPIGLRAFSYFIYRYVIRLGFLDGKEGTAFHFLQGFWYRYLVDLKLREVKTHMQLRDVDAVTAIRDVLIIDVRQ